jgi:metal-sulfur cluster biosynthetic enzyme
MSYINATPGSNAGQDRKRSDEREQTLVSEHQVREELNQIIDPCSASRGTNHSVIEMGLLDSIEIDGGDVTINMRLTSPACFMIPYFIRKMEDGIGSLEGVESVELVTDSGLNWSPDLMSPEAKQRRKKYLEQLEEHYREDCDDQQPSES